MVDGVKASWSYIQYARQSALALASPEAVVWVYRGIAAGVWVGRLRRGDHTIQIVEPMPCTRAITAYTQL
jgi:hypothetical protein